MHVEYLTGESPEDRSTNEDGSSTSPEGLEDIGPCPHPSVHEHLHSRALNRLHYFSKGIDLHENAIDTCT